MTKKEKDSFQIPEDALSNAKASGTDYSWRNKLTSTGRS
jgi:hypothetical protein